ncbi:MULTISPECIES: DUF3829 domain-containing protein [unclassified Chitinophaga]|uniref:DUF3829 domain-containing protein n=1 Tax=unclassified Chitinophaga TaxID=2619133 RepID=UPI0015C3C098|nr:MULTISPECIES: DUF3829 domain-containing protein [unclassified Chitinophaga]WPV66641.1 DUF3829 domain-containing protein [Chitinophaga sp. LS1]
MRTFICSFLVIAMFVSSTSCNNTSGKKPGASEYSENSAESASHIIEYTNLIVDMSNKHNSYLEDVVNNTTKLEEALKHPNDHYRFITINKPFSAPDFHQFNQKVKIDEPVKELSSPDKKFFKDSITKYQGLFATMQATNNRMHEYITAEDYKDDKGSKGYAIIDTLRGQIAQLYSLKSAIVKKVEVVADASEQIILKDSPLKEYIIAMKKDMGNIRSFIDLLGSEEKYAGIEAKAKAQYDSLEKAQAEHAQINIDNAKKANEDHSFNTFYDDFHKLLLNARKRMRDAGEKGHFESYDLESLDSDYDSLVRDYNNFNS